MAGRAALALLAAAMTVSPGSARIADPPAAAAPEGHRSSAGLICAWGIYATMAKVGQSCAGARNAALQAALEDSVSRMEDYARRRSPAGADFMADYRARHIEGRAEICDADMLWMYEGMSRVTPREVRDATDRLLASSPVVEWGDCI